MISTQCPFCNSDDTRLVDEKRIVIDVGDRAWYRCDGCEEEFSAIVPEPPDLYAGDGVFAENH